MSTPKQPTSYKTYIKDAMRTEPDYEACVGRLIRPGTIRLLHALMGVATESGELLDNLKKHIFYGKNIDRTNLIEEGGDTFWYIAILADELGMGTFNDMLQKNIAKLKVRYPEKFTEEKAENRDLPAEQEVLANGYLLCSACGKPTPDNDYIQANKSKLYYHTHCWNEEYAN